MNRKSTHRVQGALRRTGTHATIPGKLIAAVSQTSSAIRPARRPECPSACFHANKDRKARTTDTAADPNTLQQICRKTKLGSAAHDKTANAGVEEFRMPPPRKSRVAVPDPRSGSTEKHSRNAKMRPARGLIFRI
jgi:hypothetical protein